MTTPTRDHLGRPVVAVTGHRPGHAARLRRGGELDRAARRALRHHAASPASRWTTSRPPSPAPWTCRRMPRASPCTPRRGWSAYAALAAEEALADAGGDRRMAASPARSFSGCRRSRWLGRCAWNWRAGRRRRRRDPLPGHDRRRRRRHGDLPEPSSRSCSRGIGERLAARFGTRGAPVSLSTACATGASAIQMGVEAIQRGEARTALCIGAEGTVEAESLIRFSLLSALSTRNEEPARAARGPSTRRGTASSWPRARRRWCWRTWRTRGRAAPRCSAWCSAAASGRTASTAPAPTRAATRSSAPCARPSPMRGWSRATSATSTRTAPARRRTTRWRRSGCAPCSAMRRRRSPPTSR